MPQKLRYNSELTAANTAGVDSPLILLLPGLSIHCCGTRNYNFIQRMGWGKYQDGMWKNFQIENASVMEKIVSVLIFPSFPRFPHVKFLSWFFFFPKKNTCCFLNKRKWFFSDWSIIILCYAINRSQVYSAEIYLSTFRLIRRSDLSHCYVFSLPLRCISA